MTPERWQKVKEIFHSALLRQPEGRQTFLAEACGDDVTLHNQQPLREVPCLVAAGESNCL